jgi:hypothetical protein
VEPRPLHTLAGRRACIAANGRVESSVGMDGIWALPAMTSRAEDGTVPDARSQPRSEEDCRASSRTPRPPSASGSQPGEARHRMRIASINRRERRPARARGSNEGCRHAPGGTSAGRCGAVSVSLRTQLHGGRHDLRGVPRLRRHAGLVEARSAIGEGPAPSGHRALADHESAGFTGPAAAQSRPSPPPPARANASRAGSAWRTGPESVATSPKMATNTATISPAW